jgi:adenine deaminase
LDLSRLKNQISAARGEIPSELLIQHGTLIHVITREMYKADIAIYGNSIINVAEPNTLDPSNTHKILDATGKYISPGFIESHLHIESTMLHPSEFAKIVVPHGTTTVLLDPHEIGNVLGVKGLQLLLDQAEDLPLRFLIEIPSCVPAAPGLETSAHIIDSKTIQELIDKEPRFFGLGEVMNYPGVLFKDDEVLAKVVLGSKLNVIDGHSPNVSGVDLDAYLTAGIGSDHESTTSEEFLEKLRKGMRVMIREGSLAKDLRNILTGVENKSLDLRNTVLCSDDRNIADLYNSGHLDNHLRIAVEEGIPPITAIQMVTINSAVYLGLDHQIGSITPGKIADIVILDDLQEFHVNSVIFDGIVIYSNTKLNWDFSRPIFPPWAIDTLKIPQLIAPEIFRVNTSLPNGIYPVRVIGIKPNSVLTDALTINLNIKDGWIRIPRMDQNEDLLCLTVIERYGINGNIANGFIKGFGIKSKSFAMATTVAHDSHNVLVAGNDHDTMAEAVKLLSEIKGGYVVIANNNIGKVPLPYAGLMTTDSYTVLYEQLNELNKVFADITDFDEPLMALSFMALPVIPHLKLTDKGLVDVDNFAFTDLIVT